MADIPVMCGYHRVGTNIRRLNPLINLRWLVSAFSSGSFQPSETFAVTSWDEHFHLILWCIEGYTQILVLQTTKTGHLWPYSLDSGHGYAWEVNKARYFHNQSLPGCRIMLWCPRIPDSKFHTWLWYLLEHFFSLSSMILGSLPSWCLASRTYPWNFVSIFTCDTLWISTWFYLSDHWKVLRTRDIHTLTNTR